MIISELIKSMLDAGAPIKAILIALEALEANAAVPNAAEAEIERQRTLARDRKRRSCAARKGVVEIPIMTEDELSPNERDMSRDRHVTKEDMSRDGHEIPPLSPPLSPPRPSRTRAGRTFAY